MKTTAKAFKRQVDTKRATASRPPGIQRKSGSTRERVLIEFPAALLERTDEAASRLKRNRSELIRSAVEDYLNDMESKKFEEKLAAAYTANSKMNRDLCEEFEAVDREGF
jgi:metal-responsive CopG/Arc/MetJ family transcriptional regulator